MNAQRLLRLRLSLLTKVSGRACAFIEVNPTKNMNVDREGWDG